MSTSARTAFVTGGTGFLGRHLIEQATAAGFRVVALRRPTSNVSGLASYAPELVTGTIEDRASLERAIPEGCDVVFHAAANTSLWSGDRAQQTRDNVDGTRNVVEAALARRVKRFVHTSSEAAWGEPERTPLDESVPQRGGESWINYERTKYLAEIEIEKGIAHGLSAVIVNPAHILGRYDPGSWGRAFRLVRDGKIPGVAPGSGSWASAEEVAKAHLVAAERGRVGERYLLGGVDASYLEVFATIGRLVGRPTPSKPVPRLALKAYAWASEARSRITKRAPDVTPEIAELLGGDRTVRSDKAIAELGFRAVPIDGLLRENYDWLRQEGLL